MTKATTGALLAAAIGLSLVACAGYEPGRVSSAIGTSQGAYSNPLETPTQYRVPQTNIVTSGIPGESGVSAVSSALSGGGGGGAGGGGGGGGAGGGSGR
ncbi:MAG TPA: hypothetical protein VGU20_15185 [Stellaceae bacterium]|nr:hypothetical protein [Stellaceae bacterium]